MPILTWKDISASVPPPKPKQQPPQLPRKILTAASGYACSGPGAEGGLVAIMGASGSGKSTLLSFLAGRAAPDSGTRMIDFEPYTSQASRSIGFVPQNDKLFSTLSVLETMKLHAALRGVGTSFDFDALLGTLGLTAVANTRVGEAGATGRRRGISGGERKRVAMALELLHSPPLLLLDEPLSGLDSAAAAHVSTLLAKLARGSTAVVITLHQPASRDYATVAHLGLLSPAGQTIFFGPAAQAVAHFAAPATFSAPLPPHTIPAEHFLDVLAARTSGEGAGEGALLDAALCSVTKLLDLAGAVRVNVGDHESKAPNQTSSNGAPNGASGQGGSGGSGLGVQISSLLERANLDNLRHPAFLRAMLSRSVTMACIVGYLYSGLTHDQGSVQDRVGAIYFVLTNQIMSSSGSLRTFISEREIAKHEISAGLYGLPAYFISRSLAESVWQALMGSLFAVLTYELVGFAPTLPQFGFFVLCVALVTLCAESYAVLIGAVMPDDKSAAVVGPLVLALFMVSGSCSYLYPSPPLTRLLPSPVSYLHTRLLFHPSPLPFLRA